MSENTNSSYELIPELGDLISIISTVFKLTTGRIIYRDITLIRIRPLNASHKAVDFPLNQETGHFQDSLGVSEVLIHEKRKTPHFSKQLSTVIGEHLDFFKADGTPAEETGVVLNIFATDDTDGIQLEDGRVLDFGFIGSKPPNDVVRPRAAPDDIPPPENDSGLPAVEEEAEETDEPYPEIDLSTLPLALVEEVPTQERTYSDGVQREDMFVSLLLDIPLKRQKDPRVMQELYRTTDILLALKNSVVLRDEGGGIVSGSRSYTVSTLRDVIDRQPTANPIGALLPVVAVKKVLYVDSEEDIHIERKDVDIRNDTRTLLETLDTSDFERKTTGNAFVTHIHKILQGIAAYSPKTADPPLTCVDQDVLCSQLPYESVEGFPTTPAGYKKDFYGRSMKTIPLTLDYLGEIQNRHGRMLSASSIHNTKTNTSYTVAPADSVAPIGYVLLSEPLAAQRAPARSQMLLWDIARSEHSRFTPRLFEKTFANTQSEQIIITESDTVLDILTKRLHPTTSFINYETTQLYDTLGLRDLELTEELLKPLGAALKEGQRQWDMTQKKRAGGATAAAKKPSVPAIAATIGDFTSHLAPTEAYPVFQNAKKKLLERETSLANYDLATVPLLTNAGGLTLGSYWNAILGDVSKDRIERTETTYLAETLRQSQNNQRTLIAVKAFEASPDINTCPHVADLERIYGIRKDEQRMTMFEKCYTKYQAGQRGNYILCGTCGKDFVCKHEILLLNEFLHPGRGDALHKNLLLEFAGPVFEGAYICKVCGQKIRDIEYDTHLEFDDEGRPLIGRNVVENSEDDIDASLVIHDEVKDALPFEKDELPFYYIARTISEQCGLAFPITAYKRIVKGYTAFFENFPTREAHEKKREEAKKKKGAVISAPYDNFFATYQITGLCALIVLEIQTSTVTPPTPITECPFNREGFPLDEAPAGALTYVACIVANITRNDAPWNLTSWSAVTSKPKRIAAISNVTKSIIERILALGKDNVPLSITDIYRDGLKHERDRRLTFGVDHELRASDADILPASFRPIQRIVLPPTGEEKPVANVSRFLGTVATGPLAEIRSFVDTRSEQLALHLLNDSHITSKASVKDQVTKRSDATCCFTKLADVATTGMGILANTANEAQKKEYELQSSAKSSLENRDPAASFGGTHFYVPWAAPSTTAVIPGADPSMFYKIFIKNCYKGDRYGYPHEISVNSVCRRCGFPYPKELDMLDTSDPTAAKRREELSLAALAGVEINEESFSRLDRQIKMIKTIPVSAPRADTNFLAELATMGGILNDILLPGDIDSLIATMTDIQAKDLRDIARRLRFADVSKRYDAVRQKFMACFSGEKGKLVLSNIESLTEQSVGSTSVRNLQQILVVQGTQIACEFRNINPKGRKWFNSISRNHQSLLDKIWEKSAEMVAEALKDMDEYKEVVTDVQSILEKFTETYSQLYDLWIREIRSNIHFTDDEYKIVLRWFTLSGLSALTKNDSIYYRDITTAQEKNRVSRYLTNWIEGSVQSNAKYNKRYQLNISQIQEAINARAELEKAYFIKRFDTLDKDLRAVEKIKKGLKIGDWAVGTVKNLFTYDADFYEFERSQRAEMGLPEFGGEEGGAVDRRQEVIDGGYINRPVADED